MTRKANEHRMPPLFRDVPDEYKHGGVVHIPPAGGWKPQTYYVADVSVNPQNPLFRAIIFSGFLNGKNGRPGGYAVMLSNSVEDCARHLDSIRYVEVVSEISLEVPHADA